MVSHTCEKLVSRRQPCCLSPSPTTWASSSREADWLFGENWRVWMVRGEKKSALTSVCLCVFCVCVLKQRPSHLELWPWPLHILLMELCDWLKPASGSCDSELKRERSCLSGNLIYLLAPASNTSFLSDSGASPGLSIFQRSLKACLCAFVR